MFPNYPFQPPISPQHHLAPPVPAAPKLDENQHPRGYTFGRFTGLMHSPTSYNLPGAPQSPRTHLHGPPGTHQPIIPAPGWIYMPVAHELFPKQGNTNQQQQIPPPSRSVVPQPMPLFASPVFQGPSPGGQQLPPLGPVTQNQQQPEKQYWQPEWGPVPFHKDMPPPYMLCSTPPKK